jgi:DNA-3-methyladenine glycosylase I
MIRSERKIQSIISNAQAFRKIWEEFETFDSYLWAFSDNKTICYQGHQKGHVPAANGLSERIGKDLKRCGFKYLGSVAVYFASAGLRDDR